MKASRPSDQVLDELKRYTEDLLGFFDSKAAVEISTNNSRLIRVEVSCESFTSEDKVNLIALRRIVLVRAKKLSGGKPQRVSISVKKSILIN